jgi:hypothetical protein
MSGSLLPTRILKMPMVADVLLLGYIVAHDRHQMKHEAHHCMNNLHVRIHYVIELVATHEHLVEFLSVGEHQMVLVGPLV